MHFSNHSAVSADLPRLENAVLWTMRAWVIGLCRRRDTTLPIQGVFDQLGASTASAHLDQFMRALSRGARRSLEVNCVCNATVSEDETRLLEIIALQQEERHDEAYEGLTILTTEFAAIAGCDSANRMALTLAEAGQIFSVPQRSAVSRDGRGGATHLAMMSRSLH